MDPGRPSRGVRAALLGGVLLLAAGLRGWGLVSGQLLWHPDEIFMVVFPLNLLSGDLNPHTFSYPGFHLYLLAGLYGIQYLGHLLSGGPGDFIEWVSHRYLWEPEVARDTARWVSVAYSLGTAWLAAVLAGRLQGDRMGADRVPGPLTAAGLLAALLVAVNTLSVRQGPLAGTDAALTFWYAVATWAALTVLDDPRWRRYLAAGGLVGLCGATKYPGACAAVGLLAAHLARRGGLGDRRIWLAGLAAILGYLSFAAYTVLDFDSFRATFQFQSEHAAEGRWGLRPGPLYQLTTTLRLGAGLLAWTAWLLGCAWALWRRSPSHLVVLSATAAAYLVVNWGQLAFARYVLPLVPLQAAIAADFLARGLSAWTRRRLPRVAVWAWGAAIACVALQPLFASIRVARLQARVDTRTEARRWIEAHVPPGSTLCNFGGWAGDPQVRTYEDLWWRFGHFLQAYGVADLEPVRRSAPADSCLRYYSYAVQSGNEELSGGSLSLIHRRQCSAVTLHDHPLAYSAVDSAFRALLSAEATRRLEVDPGTQEGATYDPMDAYYVPLTSQGPARPGPRVEVWEVPQYRPPPSPQTATQVLARALSLQAQKEAGDGLADAARRTLQRARSLDPVSLYPLEVLAQVELDEGRLDAAQAVYDSMLRREPDSARALFGLAVLSGKRGDLAAAVDGYERARSLRPRDAQTLNNLAVSYRALGQPDTAVALWRRAVELQPDYGEALYNLGTALYLAGDAGRALPLLSRAIELAPDSVRYCSNAAAASRALGQPARAIELWQRALAADPSYGDALFNVAYTYQYDLGDGGAALGYWERARALAPNDVEIALHGAQACLALGRPDDALTWLRSFLERAPGHARRGEVQEAIGAIAAATGRAL